MHKHLTGTPVEKLMQHLRNEVASVPDVTNVRGDGKVLTFEINSELAHIVLLNDLVIDDGFEA
jgi:4-aminobutyrate aminotransferase-like enzyme